jgi:hypothetical protein
MVGMENNCNLSKTFNGLWKSFYTKLSSILPSPTLSDVASLFSQNPTQLRTTMRVQGKYTWPEDGDGVVGKYSGHYYLDKEVPSVPL